VSPRRDDRLPGSEPLSDESCGLQSEFYQGGAVKTLKYRVVCHGRITVRRNVPKHNASGLSGNGKIYCSVVIFQYLVHNANVFFDESFVVHLANEKFLAIWIFANMMMPEVSLSSLITGRIFFTIPFF